MTLFFSMDPLGNMPVADAILEHSDSRSRARILACEMLLALAILLRYRGARALHRLMGMLLATQMLLNGVPEFVGTLRRGDNRP